MMMKSKKMEENVKMAFVGPFGRLDNKYLVTKAINPATNSNNQHRVVI